MLLVSSILDTQFHNIVMLCIYPKKRSRKWQKRQSAETSI